MNDELDKALEWIDKRDPKESTESYTLRAGKTLAAAVRSLRETVRERDAEILALRKRAKGVYNPSLDQALNEGSGVYKP